MNRFHVAVSIALAIIGVGALIGYFAKPDMLWAWMYLGYWVTLIAVVVAFPVGLLLLIRSFTGAAIPLWKDQWLGLVNGILALGSCEHRGQHVLKSGRSAESATNSHVHLRG